MSSATQQQQQQLKALDRFQLQQKVQSDVTELVWAIVVGHWQAHLNLDVDALQQCYTNEGCYFLLDSFTARTEKTAIPDAMKVLRIDPKMAMHQIQLFMFENICLLHATHLSTTDIMLRRGLLKLMLRDKVEAIFLPTYEQLLVSNNNNNNNNNTKTTKQATTSSAATVPAAPKRATTHGDEKDKGKNSKKEILRSIEAEVALGDEQKKRFSTEEYAELSNLLNIP